MNEPNQTSRFKNPALLELCALANNVPRLQAVAGSFDDTLSAKHATINKAIWGIGSNLMFVNVQDATSTKDVSGSSYSLETAAAVMKDAVDRMEYMEGDFHTIISPYNAQVTVYGGLHLRACTVPRFRPVRRA